jgi:hypothetical protein
MSNATPIRRRGRMLVRTVRQWLGERLFDLGHWIYDYWPHYPDDEDARPWWEVSATIQATEAEADKALERLTELACGSDHHPLALCNLRVGAMRRPSDAEVDGEDHTVPDIGSNAPFRGPEQRRAGRRPRLPAND